MSTFVITSRTTPQELFNYFGVTDLPVHVKVEKLKLICRRAEMSNRVAQQNVDVPGGSRSLEALEESEKFIKMFDQGYVTLTVSLQRIQRDGTWGVHRDVERELEGVRKDRDDLLTMHRFAKCSWGVYRDMERELEGVALEDMKRS